ncbi:DUF2180 family protein [Streptomyces sp. NPDC008238]
MYCFDCLLGDRPATAVAVCRQCGAGVCAEHARVKGVSVERLAAMGMATSHKAAREITCPTCAAARESAVAETARFKVT